MPQKYYELHRFKIIDGVIVLSRLYRDNNGTEYRALAKLIVGRQASSRRHRPKPWCQFAELFRPETLYGRSHVPRREFVEYSWAEAPYESFISQYEKDLPAPDGPATTSHPLFPGAMLRARVMEKVIAGTVYNLVVVEQIRLDDRAGKQDEMVLQRDVPYDQDSTP